MNRRERRAAARQAASSLGLKGTKKQEAVRQMTAALLVSPPPKAEDTSGKSLVDRLPRLRRRESGLIVPE